MSIRNWNVQYGMDTPAKLLNRVSKEIGRRGVLDVLRKGD